MTPPIFFSWLPDNEQWAMFMDQSKGLILTCNKNLSWTRFFTGLHPSKFMDVGWKYRTKYILSRPVKNESRLIFYGRRSLKVLNPDIFFAHLIYVCILGLRPADESRLSGKVHKDDKKLDERSHHGWIDWNS